MRVEIHLSVLHLSQVDHWSEGDWRHCSEVERKINGGGEHSAELGEDEGRSGVRPVGESQLYVSGSGEVHEYEEELSQHASLDRIYLDLQEPRLNSASIEASLVYQI